MSLASASDRATIRVLPCGSRAVLVELPDLADTMALLAELQLRPLHGVTDMVPGAQTLTLCFDPHVVSAATLAAALSARRLSKPQAGAERVVEIPVRYDGEDLAEVARLTGLTEAEVVRRHSAHLWTVAFSGFAPGFAYLTGGDPALDVPRRSVPRTRIPSGSVALAGRFSGVYPTASPGGWQIIGTTPVPMWDLARSPAALLTPGDRVRFVDAPDATVVPAQSLQEPVAVAAPKGAFTVTQAPFPILVQDAGRPGHTGEGVSASGVMDLAAFRSLNRLLGNPPACAALEITGGMVAFQTDVAAVIAVTGAPCTLTINDQLHLPSHRALALDAGDRVLVSAPKGGLRMLLGVRGGFAVAPVLGSHATDTLARLGPEPLMTGATIALAQATADAVGPPEAIPDLPKPGDTVTLDVILGPRADFFSAAVQDQLSAQDWTVTQSSSRVGIRLSGDIPLSRDALTELPSEGTVRGAVQVPHSGQPVLFLADHPLTGGYPVIGVVAGYHLDLAGQIPPGAKIRFRPLAPFAEIGAFEIERQP
jgi:KipI family sensor histidine kinase inhibitor